MASGQVFAGEAAKETAAVVLEARATAATTRGIMEAARPALSAARTSAGQPNTGAALFAEVMPESMHKQQDATPATIAALEVSLPKPLPSKPTRQIDVVSAPTQYRAGLWEDRSSWMVVLKHEEQRRSRSRIKLNL